MNVQPPQTPISLALKPPPDTAVILLFWIMTLFAKMVTVPLMFRPSMTAPAWVTVIKPESVSPFPAGTPTFPEAGSGNPHAAGAKKHPLVGGGGGGDGDDAVSSFTIVITPVLSAILRPLGAESTTWASRSARPPCRRPPTPLLCAVVAPAGKVTVPEAAA